MDTSIDLPAMLEKRNDMGEYDRIIDNARNMMYHDFESAEAAPKTLLVKHLSKFSELNDITQMVINGDFDESNN